MGCVLTAKALLQHGVEPVLIPMYQQGTDIPLLKLNGLVLNYARSNNLELIKFYHNLKIHLFVLDTEGGILSSAGGNAPEAWAARLKKTGIAELVSGYFFWGRQLYTAFCEHSGISKDRLHVTGQPRYDLCSPRWRKILRYPGNDYILINTNFSAINPLYAGNPDSEKKAFLSAGWSLDYVDHLFENLQTVFVHYLHDLKLLFAENPKLTFKIRPHPFEDKSVYAKAVQGCPNAAVDASGSIFHVINNARCVLHLNCGTAVESLLLEKVPISLEYLNTETLIQHTPLPRRISFKAQSYQHLNQSIRALDDIKDKFDFSGLFESYVQPWFNDVDGTAAEKIAKILAEYLLNNPNPTHSKAMAASLRSCRSNPSYLQRSQAIANNLVGSKAGAGLRNFIQPARRAKYFNPDDVNQIFDDFAEAEGGGRHISADHARHPVSGFALSSIICKIV